MGSYENNVIDVSSIAILEDVLVVLMAYANASSCAFRFQA